jgi:hypothetical protein
MITSKIHVSAEAARKCAELMQSGYVLQRVETNENALIFGLWPGATEPKSESEHDDICFKSTVSSLANTLLMPADTPSKNQA